MGERQEGRGNIPAFLCLALQRYPHIIPSFPKPTWDHSSLPAWGSAVRIHWAAGHLADPGPAVAQAQTIGGYHHMNLLLQKPYHKREAETL